MITRKKIEIFKKYNGDPDHFARVGTSQDKINISDEEWSLIGVFIQDLELVNKGLASDTFVNRLEERIKENIESVDVLQELKSLI